MVKKILIAFVVLITLILFGASWYFSSLLMYPKPGICKKDHFVYCQDPSELDLPFEEVSFKSRDGLTLRGWFMPAKNSVKAVVQVHGHGATRYEGMRWAKSLHRAGFNLLTFDLRNSGKSDRSFSSISFHEKHDVLAAVDFLAKNKGMKKIGIFGVSMGAATGILAMSMDRRIQAGVFEAGFANLRDLLADMGRRDFGIPRFPLVPLTCFIFELRGKLDVDEINPVDVIGKISPRPIFIMHCKDDPYIPYSNSQRLFEAAGGPKEIWTHACTKHAEAWQANPSYIEKRVADFFSQNVK